MPKVGRNDPCPCGSGKKYKRCHGALGSLDRLQAAMTIVPQLRARHEANEHQRMIQQGLGRPIVATRTDSGHQVVAVRNRILASTKWKTFHDFLVDYLRDALGSEWGNAELKRPMDERHPILVWYHLLCDQQRQFIKEPGTVATASATGAFAAYLHLAYDLYALDHNAELQSKLIQRLRSKQMFPGARYEVRVAALLARAGFTLEFENEDDRTSSHCEFVATYASTGRRFSVEAKRSESGRVQRQLVRALRKSADHPRIVFIDLNAPDPSTEEAIPLYAQRGFELLRRFEEFDPEAQRLPPAYVFLTNTPWEHHLNETKWRCITLGDSLHIEEFKNDHQYHSLRAAIEARRTHLEMHALLRSMRQHSTIPATFDGDIPDFAFSTVERSLMIGSRLLVPGPDGEEVEGVLTSGVVVEQEMSATCAVQLDDGRSFIVSCPLSDAEMAAWRQHPETFFGEVSREGKCDTALDLYDFLMATYTKTPKAKLLEFMAGAPDIARLRELDHGDLASIYCERVAAAAFAQSGMKATPLLQPRRRRGS